jgi:hypothetical protein
MLDPVRPIICEHDCCTASYSSVCCVLQLNQCPGIIAVLKPAPTHEPSGFFCLLLMAVSPLSTYGSMGFQCEVEHYGSQMQNG